MKKNLTLFLTALPYFLSAQVEHKIDGVLGIPFGTSKTKTLELMKEDGFSEIKTDDKTLSFSDISYGSTDNCKAYFRFINDKMYEVTIVYPKVAESKVITQYHTLVALNTLRYGKGESLKIFRDPYEEGDGNEIIAIKSGKAEFNTFWPSSTAIIRSEISRDLFVSATFKNVLISNEKEKAEGSN